MLKSRTFVATPAYRGEVVMQYAHSLVRDTVLAMTQGYLVEAPYAINDTYLHFARNEALRAFVASDLDYLMFIDADMGWEPGALVKMLESPADMDVVGGVYTAKVEPPRYPIRRLDDRPLEFPLCELEAVATGFMRITRDCAIRMLEAYAGMPFDFAIIDGVAWGEDTLFCRRAREQGMRVFGRFDIAFEHVGPKVFKGLASADLAESAAVAA